jgi:hypothetical protein
MLVIYKAKELAIFHIISILIFNFGFCILGFGLFSHSMENFSNIQKSILTVLNIIGEEISYLEFSTADKSYGMIYIFMITFFNYLILFNLLLCIFVQTFYDVKNDIKMNFGQEIKDDFITKLYSILYKKFLLILERIQLYYYDVKIYFDLVNNSKKQFLIEVVALNNEKIDKDRKRENNFNYYDVRKIKYIC